MTWHSAFWAHVPGHGSLHLLLMHALLDWHSAFTIHSGLHPSYGFPKYSGRQEQDPAPFCSLQMAFMPHGDGSQGFKYSCGIGSAKNYWLWILYMCY